jgi:uncharacterized FlaG/YvyC family protein
MSESEQRFIKRIKEYMIWEMNRDVREWVVKVIHIRNGRIVDGGDGR